jgi:hypothetical protein
VPANLEKQWRPLSTGATFLVTLVGSFLIAPPFGNSGTIVNLVRFLVAIAIAVLLLPFAAPPSQAMWKRLAAITLALTFGAVAALFVYWTADDAWVIDYFGARTVIGTELTDKGAKLEKTLEREGHVVRNFDLLEGAAGDASLVWLEPGIRLHRFALVAMYLGLAVAFSLAAFSAIQLAGNASKVGKGA